MDGRERHVVGHYRLGQPTSPIDVTTVFGTGYELTRRMLAAGLPAGPVLNVDEAIAADHTAHRNMVTELGAYRPLGTPIKLSRTPGSIRSAPPRFNQHGEAVLRGRGFSEAEIEALAREGVLVEKCRK